jgi:hypothetical protein
VSISGGHFVGNRAYIGAGMAIYGLSTKAYAVDFSDNIAKYMGGGLFFYNKPILVGKVFKDTKLFIISSTFFGNRAQVAGGMMLVNTTLGNDKKWDLEFSNNIGLISSTTLAEYPASLTVEYEVGSPLTTVRDTKYNGKPDPDGFPTSDSDIIDYV